MPDAITDNQEFKVKGSRINSVLCIRNLKTF